jgi:hypothetical protein
MQKKEFVLSDHGEAKAGKEKEGAARQSHQNYSRPAGCWRFTPPSLPGSAGDPPATSERRFDSGVQKKITCE